MGKLPVVTELFEPRSGEKVAVVEIKGFMACIWNMGVICRPSVLLVHRYNSVHAVVYALSTSTKVTAHFEYHSCS